MSISAVMSRFKIGTRIYTGFAVVLILLGATAACGYVTLNQIHDLQQTLMVLSDQAENVLQMKANVADIRRNVRAFAMTGEDKSAEAVAKLRPVVDEQLKGITDALAGQPQAQMLAEMRPVMANWLPNFDKVVVLRNRRDDILEKTLAPLGLNAQENLSTIMADAVKQRVFEVAAYAGLAQEALLLGRINALKFIEHPEPKVADQAKQKLTGFVQAVVQLQKQITDDQTKELAAHALALSRDYLKAFEELVSAVDQYETLTNQVMPKQAQSFADLSQSLADSITASVHEMDQANSAAAKRATWIMLLLAFGAFVAGSIFAVIIARSIVRPIDEMTATMSKLAAGDNEVAIPALNSKDEIGAMARSVEVFKQNAIERAYLEGQQEIERKLKERREKAVDMLMQDFSGAMAGSLGSVGNASHQMVTTSARVSSAADGTKREVTEANEAATVTAAAVDAVAAAAEELSASIDEIGSQVVRTANEAKGAADEAAASRGKVNALVETSRKIGQIVDLITNIAAQTNLLALNATIEAARAGEAGKGFAIVAGEVKSLANQTAKATDEIALQVQSIQHATTDTAQVIETVASRIETISGIATTVAAAVEQQGAATREIAERTQEVSANTARLHSIINVVNDAAEISGEAAGQVQTAATSLSGEAANLKQEIENFLAAVRNAEERRRFERIATDIKATVRNNGTPSEERIIDISAGGARLARRMTVAIGTTIQVEIPGFAGTIAAKVAGISDAGTHLQFPLDKAHLQRLDAFIQPMRSAA
ncbi:MAG: HAMP domain-containing protein [Rhodospirillales bacterium]|nr:HAMP domain-containing protein [Rhodospirillales bacterium]